MPARPIPTKTPFWTPIRVAFALIYVAAFLTLYFVL